MDFLVDAMDCSHNKGLEYGGGCVGFYVMSMVMDGRDGSVKKMKMVEGDTCDEVVEKGFIGGHSTFNIHFFDRKNLQL